MPIVQCALAVLHKEVVLYWRQTADLIEQLHIV